VNEPLDPRLEDRLRAHFADRTASEPLPGGGGPLPSSLPTRSPRPLWQRPSLLAAAAAVLVVAGVAAGLALGGDDPEELDVVGPSSTTTSAPTTTTTTGATPTSSSTTAVPDPSAGVRSVIVAIDGLLGWWDGTRFVRGDAGDPVPASGGETYALVGVGHANASAVGSAPQDGCGLSDPPGVTIDVGLEYPADHLQPPPIAVSGVADVTPRPVVELGSQQDDVQAAVDALAELGIDDPSPGLAQVLRTDFEGDGVDEVLLVAERLSDPSTLFASPGDYSVLLLRQVVDEQVVTTVVAQSVANPGPGESPFVFVTRVAAVADLNGDGAMELVTRGVYYEGAGSAVVRVDPAGGVEELLAVGCGA
jgi:hypothetical protein